MNETYIQKTNREGYECLTGNNYPERVGMLLAKSQILRRSLTNAVEALEKLDRESWFLNEAKMDLAASAFLEYGYVDPNRQQNMDRKLSNGQIKDGNTGAVREETCRNKRDMPDDIGSNIGGGGYD